MRVIVAALALACALLSRPGPAAADPTTAVAPAALQQARSAETRAFTEQRFQYRGGGAECPTAAFVSYAHSEDHPHLADEWYNVSQIRADLVMAPPDERLTRCWAFRGLAFLDRLWDDASPTGGFFARSDLDGKQVVRPDKYADDNSLTGLAWLDAAARAPTRAERERMLDRARQTADFLIRGGLWDEAFDGGFWWNSRRGEMVEGKPTQTSGLAAEFFLRLHIATGDPLYRAWGIKTLNWIDAKLFDPATQLYRWTIHYEDRGSFWGEVLPDRYFSYDQSIMIEAHLAAYQVLADARHAERARQLGRQLDLIFWDKQRGGYNLEMGVPQVYTVYSAWITPGLLALYEHDATLYWLDRAAANVEALHATLWDPKHGGYFQRHYVCRDSNAPRCGGAAWAIGPEKSVVDQAWMQRAQALLARTLAR